MTEEGWEVSDSTLLTDFFCRWEECCIYELEIASLILIRISKLYNA
jgi:hypothetical protein